jgi:hypothetical protein
MIRKQEELKMLFNEKGDARNYSRGRRSRSDFIGPRRESDRFSLQGGRQRALSICASSGELVSSNPY